jgi:hypothetical protein
MKEKVKQILVDANASAWRHDTQQNDNQHKDSPQHNDNLFNS